MVLLPGAAIAWHVYASYLFHRLRIMFTHDLEMCTLRPVDLLH